MFCYINIKITEQYNTICRIINIKQSLEIIKWIRNLYYKIRYLSNVYLDNLEFTGD